MIFTKFLQKETCMCRIFLCFFQIKRLLKKNCKNLSTFIFMHFISQTQSEKLNVTSAHRCINEVQTQKGKWTADGGAQKATMS